MKKEIPPEKQEKKETENDQGSQKVTRSEGKTTRSDPRDKIVEQSL